MGFDGVRQLEGLPPEILMVPMPGHTWGHAGVAVAAACGARVRIPIRPQVRSFNLATSASIALGEALRQTGALPA